MRIVAAERKFGALETNATEVIGEFRGVGGDLGTRILIAHCAFKKQGPLIGVITRTVGSRDFATLSEYNAACH